MILHQDDRSAGQVTSSQITGPVRVRGFRGARRALLGYLASGASAEKLALAVALGATCGLFPVFGATTALTALVGIIFRVNPVIVQVFNYAMYPIYFPAMVGFIAAGMTLFGGGGSHYQMAALRAAFDHGWGSAVRILGYDLLYGVIVWAVLSPLIAILIRLLALRLIRSRQLRTSTP